MVTFRFPLSQSQGYKKLFRPTRCDVQRDGALAFTIMTEAGLHRSGWAVAIALPRALSQVLALGARGTWMVVSGVATGITGMLVVGWLGVVPY